MSRSGKRSASVVNASWSPSAGVRPPGFEPGTCGLRVGGKPSAPYHPLVKVLVTYGVQSV